MAQPAAEDAPTDVRLALGAVAAWLSVLATLVLPAVAGAVSGAVALLLAVLALIRRRRWSATAALLLGCAGAAALATVGPGGRRRSLAADPCSPSSGPSATVELVLSDDPRPADRRCRTAECGGRCAGATR